MPVNASAYPIRTVGLLDAGQAPGQLRPTRVGLGYRREATAARGAAVAEARDRIGAVQRGACPGRPASARPGLPMICDR